MPLPIEIDLSHHLASLGGEPLVFHCHHYNCFLQKTIRDNGSIFPAEKLLTDAASEVVVPQLAALKADAAMAQDVFANSGFGRLDLSKLSANGGEVTVSASHYALGWVSKYGNSAEPVCFFNSGFIAGAARHLHGKSFECREVECVASGARACKYKVTAGGANLSKSPGMGALYDFGARPPKAVNPNIDEMAIINACAGLPLAGDKEGNIHAFGVSLTRHYSNYYNAISFRFDQQMMSVAGEAAALAARMMLVEAGHVCAFNTFGGIMESAEWEALIKPQCKTHEDWAWGMVSVVNALGWGRWSIADLVPKQRLEMVIDGSYESNGYLASFGKSDTPRCYLATGGTAGLMNLLYNADITTRPALTPAFYEKTFKSADLFVGREVECRTMGAKQCRFVAERISL